jgi:hypothetical protein
VKRDKADGGPPVPQVVDLKKAAPSVTPLTDGRWTLTAQCPPGRTYARVLLMSMTQLVIGTALGFMVAQGVLYPIKRLAGWLQRDEVRRQIRSVTYAPGPALVSGFVRYAAPLGVGAALITLGAWAVKDHFAAKAARSAPLADVQPSGTVVLSDSQSSEDAVATAAPAAVNPPAAVAADTVDPYADADFKLPARPHRAGSALSLKETLLQRAEAKARADLLRETQQQHNRSQYDCETAARAEKYLKAGLDVWGFASWQLKYFPIERYQGATLAQCKGIKNVIDPARLDLKSAVAQGNHS